MTTHAQRQPLKELLENLHQHFGENITSMNSEVLALMESIDVSSRVIDSIRNELRENYCNSDVHKLHCADLCGEIFANFSQAMYLFSSGLVLPARMLVRTALELGIAVVYMWDMPHEYWGWVKHDEDISFSKMIAHLSTERYATHLANLGGKGVCDQNALKLYYASLSNTVHGKLSELPPLAPERFKVEGADIQKHLTLTINVQRALIDIWCGRFSTPSFFIEKQFPPPLRLKQK
jgi:hypothetical protein